MLASGVFATSGPLTIGDGTIQLQPSGGVSGTLLLHGDVTFSPVTGVSAISSPSVSGDAPFAGIVDMGGGSRTFTTNVGPQSVSAVISAQITDGSLVKAGPGVLQLAYFGGWYGPTTVLAGTLQAGTGGVLVNTSDLTVATGATFDLNNYSQGAGSLSGGGTVTLGGAAFQLGYSNSTTTFSGSITGPGAVVFSGSGSQTLSGSNSWTGGGLAVSNGTVVLTGSNSFTGNIVFSNATVATNSDAGLGAAANSIQVGGRRQFRGDVYLHDFADVCRQRGGESDGRCGGNPYHDRRRVHVVGGVDQSRHWHAAIERRQFLRWVVDGLCRYSSTGRPGGLVPIRRPRIYRERGDTGAEQLHGAGREPSRAKPYKRFRADQPERGNFFAGGCRRNEYDRIGGNGVGGVGRVDDFRHARWKRRDGVSDAGIARVAGTVGDAEFRHLQFQRGGVYQRAG